MPKSSVRWYSVEGRRELLNNTLVEAGGRQKYVVVESGSYEKTSTLTITRVKAEDSGHYTCITSNYAGKVEANFTLQVYLFAIFITLTALEPNLLPKNRMCFKITL